MRAMMVAIGASGVGGTLGCLAGIPLPGFELASALLGTLGAMAGMAAGTLLCVTAPPSGPRQLLEQFNAVPVGLAKQDLTRIGSIARKSCGASVKLLPAGDQ